MNKTTNAGIDYGLGKTNVDQDTGIRFGAIPQNAVNMEVADNIWQHGRNLSFEDYQNEAKDKLRSALSDYFSDHKWDDKPSKLDRAVADAFDAIEQDLSDVYESDNDTYLYEQDGYKIQTGSGFDLVVLKSPYYTHAQFASPCFPGGGYLLNPCADGPKTYCLGHDWFDDDKAPYPVYSVEAGETINP